MSQFDDLKLSPSGLWTAPSVIEAPRGGLQDALDIVIRRIGMAEPRPGFNPDSSGFFPPVATLNILRLLERETLIDGSFDVLAVGTHAGGYQVWSGAIQLFNPVGTALSAWVRDRIWGINTRGNLYMTTATGPRRLSTHPNVYNAAAKIGHRTYHLWAGATGTGLALLANQWVSYRICARHKDANGVIVRSGVSGRYVMQGSGTSQRVGVNIIGHRIMYNLEEGGADSPVVEVYRSINSVTYPPLDEHYYAGELDPATNADIAATGFAVFTDNVPDTSLGAALYVNALQQGIAGNHVTVPVAGCASMFNGSLFLGNLSYQASLLIGVPNSAGAFPATGVGIRSLVGTFTNGSATVTAVASTTGLAVGQIVQNNGGGEWGAGVGYTRIVSLVVNTSVTLSDAWTGANGANSRLILDTVKINNQYFPLNSSAAGGLAVFLAANIRGYLFPGFSKTGTVPSDVASTTVTANTVGIDNPDLAYVQIEQFEANQVTPASFTISATHGDQYKPALPLVGAAPLTVSQEDQPNGIAWSNNLEPEHFTALNEDRISPAGRIMAMHALGNALLVFMTKGLWRVAGSGAVSGFRFDQLDQDVRLIYAYAATRLKDTVYAHADKGIHACTENAAVSLSGVNLRDLLQSTQELANNDPGFFAVTNRKADEVIFSVPTTLNLSVGERLYVYNANTKAWTNWFPGASLTCGISQRAGTILTFYDSVTGFANNERAATASPLYTVDKAGTATTTATGASVVLAATSWTVEVGDLIQDPANPTQYFLILTVVGSTVTLDRAYSTQGAGTANIFKSFISKVTPIANLAASPGYTKCWAEGRLFWGSLEGMYQMVVSCASALSDTAVAQTRTLFSSRITRTAPESLRFVVPRNHARSTRLYASVIIRQGGANWRLEGLDIGYRVSSDRVLRKR